MKYYLAVDIGASSGRLILGHWDAGKMILEEVHRFGNGMELLIPWLTVCRSSGVRTGTTA